MYNDFTHLYDNQSPSESNAHKEQELFSQLNISDPYLSTSLLWGDTNQYSLDSASTQAVSGYPTPYSVSSPYAIHSEAIPNISPRMPQIVVPTSAPASLGHIPIPSMDYSSIPTLMPSPDFLSVTLPSPHTPHTFRPGSLPSDSFLYAPHASSPVSTPSSFPSSFPFSPDISTANDVMIPLPEPQLHRSRSSSRLSTAPLSQAPSRERVPQKFGVTYTGNPWKVEFSVSGTPGIRIEDAVYQSVELDSGGEEISTSDGSRQIHLKIRWPGYTEKGAYVPVGNNSGIVSRQRFASVVGAKIRTFALKMRKTEIDEQHREWKLGNDATTVRVENIWLISVSRVSAGTYMAELEVQRS